MIQVFFANNLGPENYFPIIFYSIFIQFTIPIVDFGLSQSFLAKKILKKNNEKIYRIGTSFHILLGIIFSLIIYILSILINDQSFLWLPFSIYCIINSFSILARVNLTLQGNIKKLNLYQYLISILSFLVLVFSYFLDDNLYNVFIIYMLSNSFFIFLFYGIKEKSYYIFKIKFTFLKDHFSFGKWITFTSFISSLFENILTFISSILFSNNLNSTFLFSRRISGVLAIGIVEPIEKTNFYFSGNSLKNKNLNILIFIILILLISYVILKPFFIKLILFFLGSSWVEHSNVIVSSYLIIIMMPLQSLINSELKILHKTNVLFYSDIFKKVLMILSLFILGIDLYFYFASILSLFVSIYLVNRYLKIIIPLYYLMLFLIVYLWIFQLL